MNLEEITFTDLCHDTVVKNHDIPRGFKSKIEETAIPRTTKFLPFSFGILTRVRVPFLRVARSRAQLLD